MEEFLTFLISPLVSDPAQIQLQTGPTTLVVQVPKADMGRLIGKHGQMVQHLRTLIRTYCKLHRLSVKYLQIREQAA